MAYDDYLNKNKMRGDVLDAPDLAVRVAQAKIAAGAANLLTDKDWQRLATRQSLEQRSFATGPTGPEQASMARAAMDRRIPRFTADELLAASQPGTVPAPQEFRVRNIPGRGESTVVQGVEIKGGPLGAEQAPLPVPEEGYGYVGGPGGYISTTPYGMQRGAEPVLRDAPAIGSLFQNQLAMPPVSMATGMAAPSTPIASAQAKMINIPDELSGVSRPIQPLTTDVLGMASIGRVSPDIVASQLLGPAVPKTVSQAATQPAQLPQIPQDQGMTVKAVIPEGITGQTELAPQAVEQPMVEQPAQVAAPQLPVYRPPQLKIEPFNVRQMMSQPSVSETLGMTPALRAYQAQTQAQIAAYKANVQAQRNAVNDSINAQVKALNLRKGEADLLKTQLANQYAVGGPSTGVTKVGNKNVGFFQDGPNSFKLVELDPKISAYEQNLKIRQDAYANVSRLISSGDDAKAMEAFTALTGRPENFAAFKLEVQSANQPVVEQPKPKQTTSKQTAKTTEVLGGKYKVTELK